MKNIIRIQSRLFAVLLFLVTLALGTGFASSTISNARAVGLAGAYTALAHGIESPSWNPANLALYPTQFSMNLISLGIGVNNNSFSKRQYDLYNGAHLTPQDLENILGSIPGDGLDLDFLMNSEILGFAFKNYALTVRAVAAGHFKVAKDLPALLPGNEIGRTYDFTDCDGLAWAYISYGFAAAFPITIEGLDRFAVGFGLNYLQGLYVADVIEFDGNLRTDPDFIYSKMNGAVQYAPGGAGLSLDLGASARINSNWALGIAFPNLINNITWARDAEIVEFSASPDSFNLYDISEAEDEDSLFNFSDSTHAIGSFTTTIPQQVRIGAVYQQPKYLLALDYIQGFRRGPGVTTTPQLAGGIEYRPLSWLPLRLGLAVGGRESILLALGCGLKLSGFWIDFGVTNQGGLLPSSSQGTTFAFGLRIVP
jgi:hypothetical protein